MKHYLQAARHLFLFKTYTTMPRNLEICYGVTAWFGLVVTFYPIIKYICEL